MGVGHHDEASSSTRRTGDEAAARGGRAPRARGGRAARAFPPRAGPGRGGAPSSLSTCPKTLDRATSEVDNLDGGDEDELSAAHATPGRTWSGAVFVHVAQGMGRMTRETRWLVHRLAGSAGRAPGAASNGARALDRISRVGLDGRILRTGLGSFVREGGYSRRLGPGAGPHSREEKVTGMTVAAIRTERGGGYRGAIVSARRQARGPVAGVTGKCEHRHATKRDAVACARAAVRRSWSRALGEAVWR